MSEDKYDWRSVLGRVRSAAENRSRVMAPAYLPWDGSCRTQRINGHFISGEDLDYLEADLDAANARIKELEGERDWLAVRTVIDDEDTYYDTYFCVWASHSHGPMCNLTHATCERTSCEAEAKVPLIIAAAKEARTVAE